MAEEKKGSVGSGFRWMLILSLLLCWLPVIGPFLAGFVGGKKTGGVVKAFLAALIPIGLLAAIVFAIGAGSSGALEVGAVLGVGVFVLVMLEICPLLLGGVHRRAHRVSVGDSVNSGCGWPPASAPQLSQTRNRLPLLRL